MEQHDIRVAAKKIDEGSATERLFGRFNVAFDPRDELYVAHAVLGLVIKYFVPQVAAKHSSFDLFGLNLLKEFDPEDECIKRIDTMLGGLLSGKLDWARLEEKQVDQLRLEEKQVDETLLTVLSALKEEDRRQVVSETVLLVLMCVKAAIREVK